MRNPLDQVKAAKDEIVDLYLPAFAVRRREGSAARSFALVSSAVVFTRAPDAEVQELLHPFLSGLRAGYDRLAGREALEGEDATSLLPDAGREHSWLMSDEIADGFRQWLDEPSFSREQREPLVLDSQQRDLASGRTTTGYRRVRGPAGSGKTCVLAARAATLKAEGQRVLVVTFNFTLLNYVRDLAVRWPPAVGPRATVGSIEYLSFHYWCKRIAFQHGLRDAYRNLWVGSDAPGVLEAVLRTRLAELVEGAADDFSPDDRYDAILVDEGQDLLPEWWRALRRALRPGGEMLLVADATQDVYGTSERWTEGQMRDSGFDGVWGQLRSSYRLPRPAIEVARRFAQRFLPAETRLLPEPAPQQELAVDPCRLRWVDAQPDEGLAAALRREIDELLVDSSEIELGPGVHPMDIVLLVDTGALGRSVVQLLEADRIAVEHTFSDDGRKARSQKLWFFKGDPRVKATTVHGFKGWEGRALVVGISRCATPDARALVYTALTRVRHDPRGSYLTVVSAAKELTAFGKTWPTSVTRSTADRLALKSEA